MAIPPTGNTAYYIERADTYEAVGPVQIKADGTPTLDKYDAATDGQYPVKTATGLAWTTPPEPTVTHDATLAGDGTATTPLSVVAPATQADSDSIEHVLITFPGHTATESTVYTLKIINHDTDELSTVLVFIKADAAVVSSFTMQQYGKFKPYVEYYRATDYADTLRLTLTNDAEYEIVAEAYSNGKQVKLSVAASDTVPEGTGYIVENHTPVNEVFHDGTMVGTGAYTDPLGIAEPPKPNPVSTFRINDMPANAYFDIQMTFVQWEPFMISIAGVNAEWITGRWGETATNVDVVGVHTWSITPLGDGKLRLMNTSNETWYGNIVQATYLPSEVTKV
jgi:hypothetical protein